MKVMIVYNLVLLILFVTFSECHDYQQQHNHNHNVNGRSGHNIKSYGGYFHDSAGYNEAANNFVNAQNYYRPTTVSYQPYGWNFNQPTRTYGGVNLAGYNLPNYQNPHAQDNRIGWRNSNNYAHLNPNPYFPTLPQPNLFVPNIFPQFTFPTYPNMFPINNNYPHAISNHPGGQHIGTNNNHGNDNIQPNNHGPLPYPHSNINQGFSTVKPNINNEENNRLKPNHGQIPQTSGHQGIPTGNISRPSPNKINPNEVQFDLNHVTTTEANRNKVYDPTTVKPITSTIINTILGGDNGNDEGVDYQFPLNPDFSKPINSSGIDIRTTATTKTNVNSTRFSASDLRTDDNNFASNSFFENNDKRLWTKDDELKWLATTKAPYFENKAPGLECTLPAAAVLGAENAFKFSTLLPLDVPPGKPLLSCNATVLLQSQIRLDGMIYDCSNGDITLSCFTHGGLVDECKGQILQCDNDNFNIEKVWCTNGTLVSNSDVECRNAFVEAHKSTLNCFFKPTRTSDFQTTQRPSFVNLLPVLPLPTPDNTNHDGIDNRNEDNFNYGEIDEQTLQPQDLMPQVKNAMKNVFPHDLLSMPSTRYLPPKSSMQPLNPSLKNLINDVYNTDMLASTKNEDVQSKTNNHPSLNNRNQDNFSNVRDQMSSNWNFNSNIETNRNNLVNTKDASSFDRFGGEDNQQRKDLHDRHIFTD